MKKSKLLNRKKGRSTSSKAKPKSSSPKGLRIMGISALLVSLILLISFVSYLYTWKVDQDKVLQFSWELLVKKDVEIHNWLGRIGAIVSNYFFYWGFGVASFVFVAYGLLLSGLLYFKFSWKRVLYFSKYVLLTLLYVPVLLEFVFHQFAFPWGGAYGTFVHNWLNVYLGWIGTCLVVTFVGLGIAIWHDKLVPGAKMKSSFLRQKLDKWVADWKERQKTMPSTEGADDGWTTPAAPVQKEEPVKPVQEEPVKPIQEVIQKEMIADSVAPIIEEKVSEHTFDFEEPAESKVEKTKTPKVETRSIDVEVEIPEGLHVVDENTKEMKVEAVVPEERNPMAIEQGDAVGNLDPYDPTSELSGYQRPSLELLVEHADSKLEINREELEDNKNQIVRTLEHYKIKIEKIRATIGPTVTLYEIVPEPGVRISKIKNLEDDIALSLAALGIRIIAPIPGKGTIGIEVPNKNPQIVGLKEVLKSDKYKLAKMELPIALGKTISNEVFVGDLAKMPHLLIAGATGQGKSVGINTVISSLLYKKHPSQLKLVLIDPKKVELFPYSKLDKHFLAFLPGEEEPIITDTKKVVNTLNSLCIEMDNRYDLLKKARARNIKEYNKKFVARELNPNNGHDYMPFIVLVIDEFADLIMTAGKEVELPIARLAQLARAVGIHLIVATQRPSVNIITGVIKANFPARLAFKVTSKVDSRTILDQGGAEQLIGRGDMLLSVGGGDLVRLQCAFIDTPEVERVIDTISDQRGYVEPFYLPEYIGDDDESRDPGAISAKDLDGNFEDAARLVVSSQHGSTSMIQRRMKLGYNRAGRIMDQLEAFGIVGENKGSKARDVLFQTEMELEQHLEQIRKAAQSASPAY